MRSKHVQIQSCLLINMIFCVVHETGGTPHTNAALNVSIVKIINTTEVVWFGLSFLNIYLKFKKILLSEIDIFNIKFTAAL